jgi:predicted DCC family thiol-disulfide oxidoreductase YuxK
VRAPLLDHLGPIAVVALLILHGLAPPSPFGSWDARGRVDPGSGWRLPPTVYATTWFLMVLGVVHAGLAAVVPPSSVVASLLTAAAIIATLLLWPRMRRLLWVALLGVQLAALAFIDARGLNAGLFLLQPFTFDPSWIAARISNRGSERDHTVIYYDGSCGLCHRTVRFLLAEDAAESRFRYAPLDSEAFQSALLEATSGFHSGDAVPDSVVVHRPGMPMLTRAAGALEIGEQLGGLWRLIAVVVGWLPMRVSNGGYDFIARVRHRIFKRPADACPLLPAELRARFLP